ncbi:MAG: TIGR04282 family arsenosugar biosynthesis glycosyltransferase [Saprospiraceae bacterium]|nr:TIGR04282 family arsenosugar biosynthesis glycosyltransferase [Saprospiraceae bacterium]
MNSNKHLIVFIKNPEMGKVKTRIAATTGDLAAFNIYLRLLEITRSNTSQLTDIYKNLYYSEQIAIDDEWPNETYVKMKQSNGDLGHKMKMAFNEVFDKLGNRQKSKVLIIGSDCPEVTQSIIFSAYELLDKHDVVIGPTYDGGYYLLGMNDYFPFLFDGIAWSTADVFNQTLQIISNKQLTVATLHALNDIDTEADWMAYQKRSTSAKENS